MRNIVIMLGLLAFPILTTDASLSAPHDNQNIVVAQSAACVDKYPSSGLQRHARANAIAKCHSTGVMPSLDKVRRASKCARDVYARVGRGRDVDYAPCWAML